MGIHRRSVPSAFPQGRTLNLFHKPRGTHNPLFAVVVFFLTADFPEEAKWLSDDEKAFVKARLAEEFGDSQLDAKQTRRDVLGILKDPKIILGGFTYFGIIVPVYAYAFFAPTILRSLGYTPRHDSALLCPSHGRRLRIKYSRRHCV